MIEILTSNGITYNVETAYPLTLEQKTEVLRQLENQETVGCQSCHGSNSISTLGTGCSATPIPVGGTKNIAVTATGTGPFVYRVYLNNVLKATYPATGTTTLTTYTFANFVFDTAGTFTVKTEVTDGCGAVASDSCSSIIVQTRVLTTITISGCSSSITIGGTCTLSASCTDQFNDILLCPSLTWWTSQFSHVSVGTTGIVTGLSVGTSEVKAYYGNIISNIISVTVGCASLTCNFVMS